MTDYAYWNWQFDSLIRYAAPELADIDRPLPTYQSTVAATGIDPAEITWKELTR